MNSSDLAGLVDPNDRPRVVADGFEFLEGPVWDERTGSLVFSDIIGDRRLRYYASDGRVADDRVPASMANGLAYDADGRLLICEHATSTVVRESADGSRETLASHFDGKELNSPNDVVTCSDGSIIFTDPWYGRMPVIGIERPRELGFQGVYRLSEGDLELLVAPDEFEMPNGLCFSPDRSLLYINDTPRALVRVYDVGPDYSLANGRLFRDSVGDGTVAGGYPDGMKCDERGNVWVTGAEGIWVLSPEAELLGVIPIPDQMGNLAWGSPDWRTLFVTASSRLYAIRTIVGPAQEPFMARAQRTLDA